jgi:CarD family transcriptional regulator
MFEKGEYIIYGTSGVCRVEEITEMKDFNGELRPYYVLAPSSQKGGKIFTPVENARTPMRRIMTRDEAEELIDRIPGIQELWITNEKQREELYKGCMKTCDCGEWIRIIKTLYLRRVERTARGKKITSVDERYLKMAEDYLYSELELVLGIPKNRVEQYIGDRIAEMRELGIAQ